MTKLKIGIAAFAVAAASTLLAVGAVSAKPKGGGGDKPKCKHCDWHAISGQFACSSDAVIMGSRQGECEMWWHMGIHNCQEPTGPICLGDYPLPNDPHPALF